jgi:hypothetical protein
VTLRDRRDIDGAEGLATWLVRAGAVAYWWFMLRAVWRFLASIAEGAEWLREWREEDRQ